MAGSVGEEQAEKYYDGLTVKFKSILEETVHSADYSFIEAERYVFDSPKITAIFCRSTFLWLRGSCLVTHIDGSSRPK